MIMDIGAVVWRYAKAQMDEFGLWSQLYRGIPHQSPDVGRIIRYGIGSRMGYGVGNV